MLTSHDHVFPARRHWRDAGFEPTRKARSKQELDRFIGFHAPPREKAKAGIVEMFNTGAGSTRRMRVGRKRKPRRKSRAAWREPRLVSWRLCEE